MLRPGFAAIPAESPSVITQISALALLAAAACVGMPHALVSNFLIIACAFSGFAWLANRARRLRRQQLNTLPKSTLFRPLALALMVFLTIVVARFAWSALAAEPLSMSGLGHFVAILPAFWLARVLAPHVSRFAHAAIVFGCVLVAAIYVLTHLFDFPDFRVFSPYKIYVGNDAIVLALMLAVLASGAALEALTNFWRGRKRLAQRWGALAFLASVALVQFGMSRSAFVVFLVAVVIGCMLTGRTLLQRIVAAALAVVLIFGAYAASPSARARISSASTELINALGTYDVSTSQGQRLALTSVSLRIWKDAPIIGHGLGSWREQFQTRVPPQWQKAIGHHTSPHSEYLHVAGQLGIVGLVAYCGVIIALLWLGISRIRVRQAPWVFVLGIAWAVGGLTNVVLWDFRFWSPLSALIACALAVVHQSVTVSDLQASTRLA